MNDSEKRMYYQALNEGFLKSTMLLQNELNILEKASVSLRESFSVEQIISCCMNKNQLKDIPLINRKDFLKTVFEIYFNYSKNLLLHFDIYSEKSITENTSQIVTYLSKIPHFTKHLSLLGYTYADKEWKYVGLKLTSEGRDILELVTICCCLGYSYLEKPFQFLSLTVFDQRRRSLRTLMETYRCEYCNFELNTEQFCCSICNEGIEKMDFFKNWEINFNDTLSKDGVQAYMTIDTSTKSITRLAAGLAGSQATWKCPQCTFVNQFSCSSCSICFQEKKDTNANLLDHPDGTYHSIEKKYDMNPEVVSIKDTSHHNDTDSGQTWKCPQCTFFNPILRTSCGVCNRDKEFTNSNVPNSPYGTFRDIEKSEIIKPTVAPIKDTFHNLYTDSQQTWTCPLCTFVNPILRTSCGVCNHTITKSEDKKHEASVVDLHAPLGIQRDDRTSQSQSTIIPIGGYGFVNSSLKSLWDYCNLL